jgi:murein DD-endopeptidase MepM/ murein hydrolase activator NlpD
MHFGWNEPYPANLAHLTSDGKHKGADYLVCIGTPVIASVDGIISEISETRDFGLHIIIKFTTGMLCKTYYHLILAHLSQIITKKTVGNKINKTEIIGLSGDSGSAKGHPHLHVQCNKLVKSVWVPVNPAFAIGES